MNNYIRTLSCNPQDVSFACLEEFVALVLCLQTDYDHAESRMGGIWIETLLVDASYISLKHEQPDPLHTKQI